MSLMKSELCVPGDYFFREGESGANLYFLVDGIAEVVVDAGTAAEALYRRLREGDYFGEWALDYFNERTLDHFGEWFT